MNHERNCVDCHSKSANLSVHQSLDELDFERGIWSAALNGESDRVEAFLSKGINPDVKDFSGYTALHYASRNGHLRCCELLISSGASVNLPTPGGSTCLHRASHQGHYHIVDLLLKSNGDPELCDSDGKNALHKAVESRRKDVIKLLVNHCPNLKSKVDKRNRKPSDLTKDHSLIELLI